MKTSSSRRESTLFTLAVLGLPAYLWLVNSGPLAPIQWQEALVRNALREGNWEGAKERAQDSTSAFKGEDRLLRYQRLNVELLMAEAVWKSGQRDEAERFLGERRAAWEDYPSILCLIIRTEARWKEEGGDLAGAIDLWQEALAAWPWLVPEVIPARTALIRLFMAAGRGEEARAQGNALKSLLPPGHPALKEIAAP